MNLSWIYKFIQVSEVLFYHRFNGLNRFWLRTVLLLHRFLWIIAGKVTISGAKPSVQSIINRGVAAEICNNLCHLCHLWLFNYFRKLNKTGVLENMLVSGRFDVGLDLIRRHLRGVPMILLGGKVSSERLQSIASSGRRWRWADP